MRFVQVSWKFVNATEEGNGTIHGEEYVLLKNSVSHPK